MESNREASQDFCKALYRLVPVDRENDKISQSVNENTEASLDSTGPAVARPVLYLFDREVLTLGRCRLTQIRDLCLSRKQVRIEARCDMGYVEVTQLGKMQNSFVNGQPLVYPWSRQLHDGDLLSLSEDNHEYKLERVQSKTQVKFATPAPSRKRHITETFEVATASSTPSSTGKPRKSQRLSEALHFTPQGLVNQLQAISTEKNRRRVSLIHCGKSDKKSIVGHSDSEQEKLNPEPNSGHENEEPQISRSEAC